MNSLNEQPFLSGQLVCLRPLKPQDAEGDYPGWLNDAEVSAGNSHHVYPYTRSMADDFIKSQAGRKDQIVLAVIEKKSQAHVGNVSLQGINYISRSAELAILLGAKSCWGRGLGFEACRLLVSHGFGALNLHRIELGTPSMNTGMQKIALKLGMVQEGVKRDAFFKNGEYHDIFIYGLLKSEFGH